MKAEQTKNNVAEFDTFNMNIQYTNGYEYETTTKLVVFVYIQGDHDINIVIYMSVTLQMLKMQGLLLLLCVFAYIIHSNYCWYFMIYGTMAHQLLAIYLTSMVHIGMPCIKLLILEGDALT